MESVGSPVAEWTAWSLPSPGVGAISAEVLVVRLTHLAPVALGDAAYLVLHQQHHARCLPL